MSGEIPKLTLTSDNIQLGRDGAHIKDNNGAVEIRNEADDNYQYLRCKPPVATNDAVTLTYFDTEIPNNSAVAANTAKNSYPSADATKLAGIEALAEVNNISDINAAELTGGGEITLHSHPDSAGAFIELSDVPSSYTGQVGKLPKVNFAEDALEFVNLTNNDVGLGNIENILDKINATAPPTATDDYNAGYRVGSVWLDYANKKTYKCVREAIGVAEWVETSNNISNTDATDLTDGGETALHSHAIGLATDVTINVTTTDEPSDIQAQLDLVPKFAAPGANPVITIQFADGTHTWTETTGLVFLNFNILVIIQGNSSDIGLGTTKSVILDSTAVTGSTFNCQRCKHIYINSLDVEMDDISSSAFYSEYCEKITVVGNYFHAATKVNSSNAVYVACGSGIVQSNYFSSVDMGIYATISSHLCSLNNDDTGTAPNYGLVADLAATIGKSGTQPVGSTANELASTGGVIR